MFGLIGINIDNCIEIVKPTRFRTIVVPQPSFIYDNGARFYTIAYKNTIQKIINAALKNENIKDKPDKIYFSRTKWIRQRDDYGEIQIIKEVKKHGFKVISPEQHTIAEQIQYLQQCKCFMVTDGSIAHNALFLKEGSDLVLLRKGLYVNEYSATIIDLKQLNATIIDCSMSTINNKGVYSFSGPFFIYCNKWLCEYLGIARKIFPFKLYKKYKRNIWRYNYISARLACEDDYRDLMDDELKFALIFVNQKLKKYIPFNDSTIGKNFLRKIQRHFIEYLIS